MKTAPAVTPLFPRLEQRIANQENRINRGEKAGTLTAEEAKGLREKLTAVQTNLQNDRFDGDGLTRGQDFKKQLNGISKEIKSSNHNDAVDLTKRADSIDARIKTGLADGSLTADEAAKLQDGAKTLRGELAAATTPEAQKALNQKFNDLSKSVHKERHDGEMDAGKRLSNFTDRITAGLKDGSLNEKEASRLFDRAAKLGASGTADPKAVNALNRSIFHQRHDQNVNVPVALKDLTARVDSLATAGRLTPDQASAYRAQLVELGKADAAAAGPRLNVLRAQLAGLVG